MFKSFISAGIICLCVIFPFTGIGGTQTADQNQGEQPSLIQLMTEEQQECVKSCIEEVGECKEYCEGDKDCLVDCLHEYIDCLSACEEE